MGAFIDLKKELDTIKHRILIPKFQTFGLRDAASQVQHNSMWNSQKFNVMFPRVWYWGLKSLFYVIVTSVRYEKYYFLLLS